MLEIVDDRRRLASTLGTHHPVSLPARRGAPSGLHDQQHRNLKRQLRKTIKTRGSFPDEQAATKLIYLALMRAEVKWKKVMRWTNALRALKIHFGDRIPD